MLEEIIHYLVNQKKEYAKAAREDFNNYRLCKKVEFYDAGMNKQEKKKELNKYIEYLKTLEGAL